MNIKPLWLEIHKAIHTKESTHVAGRTDLPIHETPSGLRFVELYDLDMGYIKIMEQNPHKTSPYAQRAKAGETLSWVMPKVAGSSWILIEESVKQEETV